MWLVRGGELGADFAFVLAPRFPMKFRSPLKSLSCSAPHPPTSWPCACEPSRIVIMRLSLVLPSLLALIIPLVSGTALTYKLNGNEKSCFFTDVPRQNAKVAFYFAVCIDGPHPLPP